MTRAMCQLYLSHAEVRRLHGREDYPAPSRFLREIPPDLIEDIRLVDGARGGQRAVFAAECSGGFYLGQRVRHPKFGAGVLLASEGAGASARVRVAFETAGTKWLVLAYAPLEPCSSRD